MLAVAYSQKKLVLVRYEAGNSDSNLGCLELWARTHSFSLVKGIITHKVS